MAALIGCSGWSYDDWVGKFYPADLGKKKGEWLSYYSRYFSTVEINSTFYRVPNEFMVRSWIDRGRQRQGFEFSVKLPELQRVAGAMNQMVVAFERMLTEQSDLAETMRKKAYVDPVTGLMNRNDFSERVAHLIGAPTKFPTGVLAVIRIRGFMAYNEKNGRVEGDALLKRAAKLLGQVTEKRAGALLAKLDGPEFAVVVPELAEADVPALGDALIAALAEIEEFPRSETSVMAHAGMTFYRYREGAMFGKLMATMGAALGVAQARGVPAWHMEMEAAAEAVNTMYAEINGMFRVGLPSERVALQFQPVRPTRLPEAEWTYRSESCVRILGSDGQLIRAGMFIATAKQRRLFAQVNILRPGVVVEYRGAVTGREQQQVAD